MFHSLCIRKSNRECAATRHFFQLFQNFIDDSRTREFWITMVDRRLGNNIFDGYSSLSYHTSSKW